MNLNQLREAKFYPLLLSVSSAVILWLCWPTKPFYFLVFIGFVPLIELTHLYTTKRKSGWGFFGYTYLSFLLWNIFTTWWVFIADSSGAVMAIVLNSLFMSVPFMAYRYVKKGVKPAVSSLSLICFWIGWEYLHLNWDLSWPWLTLGNVFAVAPFWVQWYEYTGVLGGSVWVLWVNILMWVVVFKKEIRFAYAFVVIILLVLPFMTPTTDEDELLNEKKIEVVVAQPNLDPETKFDQSHEIPNVMDIIKQSEAITTAETDYIFWPETTIQGHNKESHLDQNYAVELAKAYQRKFPNSVLVTGIESWNQVDSADQKVSTKYRQDLGYYETYNAALMVKTDSLQVYHKSKLVPGAEIIPFPGFVGALTTLMKFPHMGNYTKSDSAIIFDRSMPLICYESIYGDYVREFVEKGAGFVSIITLSLIHI